ncbi:MAG: class I SAM-dependent methyltransferase [Lewinellaceae bacterium]|nr:class I SAM-dependent methyltransferase [Lewinellaceae bacterium]
MPERLKGIIKTEFRKHHALNFQSIEKNIPKYELSEKHMKNLQAVTNRDMLVGLLPKGGIVAELGVAEGKFSKVILSQAHPRKLHLVDSWNSERYPVSLRTQLENAFQEEIKRSRVEIHTGGSLEVGETLPDSYFDWVYIDTDHSYQTTLAELELYKKKVKKGGFIAGHDFITGNWLGMVKYGVIEAVHEFCVKNDWEITYLTMELNTNPSFAIKAIS